jgi:hypothetical protein
MSLIALVVDDEYLDSMYSLNLKVYTGSEVIVKKSVDEVLKVLEVIPGMDLIIIHQSFANSEDLRKLEQFVEASLSTYIRKICIGEKLEPDYFDHVVEDEKDIQSLLRFSAQLLGITAKDMAKKLISQLFPIPTTYFRKLAKTNVDIFSRSVDSSNEELYYKVLDAYGKVPEKFVENKLAQGVPNLFVMAEDRVKFTNYYSDEMLKRIDFESDPNKVLGIVEESMEHVRSSISESLDISPKAIELADKAIEKIITSVKSAGKLKDFLERLLKNSKSFSFQHSQMITYICFHMLKNLNYEREAQKKLAFSAFYHDIVLSNDKLVRIHSRKDAVDANLSERDFMLVEQHAQLASRLVLSIPSRPLGTEVIIKEHHGAKNGVGFNSDLKNVELDRLSMVFMVAEDFVHTYFNYKGRGSILEYTLDKMFEKYPMTSAWDKTIKSLADLQV